MTRPLRIGGAGAAGCLLKNTRKTECGANLFLVRLAVRASPFALLKNRRGEPEDCQADCKDDEKCRGV